MQGLCQVKYEQTDYSGMLGDEEAGFLRAYADRFTTGGDGLGDVPFYRVAGQVSFGEHIKRCKEQGNYIPEQLVEFISRQLAVAGEITLAILE